MNNYIIKILPHSKLFHAIKILNAMDLQFDVKNYSEPDGVLVGLVTLENITVDRFETLRDILATLEITVEVQLAQIKQFTVDHHTNQTGEIL